MPDPSVDYASISRQRKPTEEFSRVHDPKSLAGVSPLEGHVDHAYGLFRCTRFWASLYYDRSGQLLYPACSIFHRLFTFASLGSKRSEKTLSNLSPSFK
jgi:hypothetical protein